MIDTIFQFVLFGVILSLIVYNLFARFESRNRSYFGYLGYGITVLLTTPLMTGWAHFILIKLDVVLPVKYTIGLTYLLSSIVLVSITSFAHSFLDLNRFGFCKKIEAFHYILAGFQLVSTIMFFVVRDLGYDAIFVETARNIPLALNIYLFISLYLAWRHKDKNALYFFIAFFMMIAFGSYWVTAVEENAIKGGFHKYSLYFGTALEMMLLSFAISSKYKRLIMELNGNLQDTNEKLQTLNTTLEQKVTERTRDIQSIMTHAPIGIVLLSDREVSLEKPYSRDVERIFCRHQVDHMSLVSLIEDYFEISSQEIYNMKMVLSHSIQGFSLNFEANLIHLPTEINSKDGRFFRFGWSTVENDNLEIDKIIVTIDEITEMKQKENALRRNSEEMLLVEQLLSADELSLRMFFDVTAKYFRHNRDIIEREKINKLSSVYANVHTTKGSASSLGLKQLSESVHTLEEYLSLCREDKQNIDFSKISELHRIMETVFDSYLEIYTRKIGRTLSPEIRLSTNIADEIFHELNGLSGMNLKILDAVAVSLEKFAERLLRDRKRLAKDLEKPIPDYQVFAKGYINHKTASVIEQCFVHLLRNSMDHGIESAAVRIESGKPASALLSLDLQERKDGYHISYWDDGSGLNLKKIREISVFKGLINPEDELDDVKLNELIFHEGLSTAKTVTDISGRGVGMRAVKRFVTEAGGALTVDLGERRGDYVSFRIKLFIPDQHIVAGYNLVKYSTS
ncbi:MAG: Hpt domain-containing protein [Pseudobacteriovorax sp.]|nr:Hpt domain-containing protein [Pseudobacteriovorax sp.]